MALPVDMVRDFRNDERGSVGVVFGLSFAGAGWRSRFGRVLANLVHRVRNAQALSW